MGSRMAGFSPEGREKLIDKGDYTDKNGEINYKALVREVDKITSQMAKEVRLLESI